MVSAPTFDHRIPGTPESAWLEDPRLADVPGLDVPQGLRLLVVAAHPDDETLTAGGLLHRVQETGGSVRVVVASDGERSHPRSPTTSPARLALRRRTEVADAVGLLAADAVVTHLGLPDGELDRHADALADAVRDGLEELGGDDVPGPLWCVTTWRDDAHPDHAAVALACAGVVAEVGARLLEAPIWAWEWAVPGDERLPWDRMRAVELPLAARAAKVEAIGRHASQTEPLSPAPGDEAVLPPHVLAHFTRCHETFVVAASVCSTGPEHFEHLYAAADDPWRLAEGWYEQRKRDLLLASLPDARYERAFEPGCAIGLLTEELAARCDEVVAWDVAQTAVEQTRRRVAGRAVEVRRARVPDDWPDGRFDLVVLSELGYYLGGHDLGRLVARVETALTATGHLVLCHWRHPADGHVVPAEEVHRAVSARAGLRSVVRHVEDDFLLEVFARPGARSLAQREGRTS